jgi:hypothetical protein
MSTSFEIYTAAGVLIRTFDSHTAARRWALANKAEFPGLYVESVTRVERRSRLWSDRASLRAEAA